LLIMSIDGELGWHQDVHLILESVGA